MNSFLPVSNQKSLQNYFHFYACLIPYSFCDCSLIPQHLTSTVNYETPENASFSAKLLCRQFKHYSHHSVHKRNQLINCKRHSQVLKALFHVIRSMHLFAIHILTNKIDKIKSNQSEHKPHFILYINYKMFQHQGPSSHGLLKTEDRLSSMYFRCQLPSLS